MDVRAAKTADSSANTIHMAPIMCDRLMFVKWGLLDAVHNYCAYFCQRPLIYLFYRILVQFRFVIAKANIEPVIYGNDAGRKNIGGKGRPNKL